MLSILVAIPCLNEGTTIGRVVDRIPRQFKDAGRVDVLVVDDGSTDDTVLEAQRAGAMVLSHSMSRGVGCAFRTAVGAALHQQYDVLVTIDGDGQFKPQQIPELVQPIVAGRADCVTGSRFVKGGVAHGISPAKRWGNHQMSRIVSSLLSRPIRDVSCGFRAYSREALLQLNLHGDFTYTQESILNIARSGLRIEETPVEVEYFDSRKSRVAHSLLLYGVRASTIIGRAYRDHYPMRFFGALAALCFLPGVSLCLFLLAHYVRNGQFSGHIWAGFVGGGLCAAGLILILLGVVASLLRGVRINQERILYHLRQMNHSGSSELRGAMAAGGGQSMLWAAGGARVATPGGHLRTAEAPD